MDALPRLAAVSPRPGFRLHLRWQDGREDVVDMADTVAAVAAFAPLREPSAFAEVRTVAYGDGIAWDCGVDFSADSLDSLAAAQRAPGLAMAVVR